MMIHYLKLEPADREAFLPLTYRSYRKELMDNQAAIAYGAVAFGSVPVGLVLAIAETEEAGSVKILSIYVVPKFRRCGIGRELLHRLEKTLTEQGMRQIYCRFGAEEDGDASLSRLVSRGGWEAPRPGYKLYRVDLEKLLSGNRLLRKIKTPRGFTLTRLTDMTCKDKENFKASLSEEEQKEWVGFDPFRPGISYEPETSLVLRDAEGIAGWVITEQTEPGSLAYPVLYVRPKYRKTRLAFVLMAFALCRQAEIGLPISICKIGLSNGAMLNMFAKRFAFAVIKKNTIMVTRKLLDTGC